MTSAVEFSRKGAVVALAALFPALAWGLRASLAWSAFGWLLASVSGLLAGTWVAARVGAPGAAFLRAFGTSMLARSLVFGAGAVAAAQAGTEAAIGYLGGLAIGLLSVLGYEVVWCLRAARSVSLRTPGGWER